MKHIEWKIIRKQNESDLITDLLAPNVGLNLFTPVNINDGNDATINSDPHKDTYIERRIDYILPSDALASYGIYGSILNTWSYTAETIPDGLELTDASLGLRRRVGLLGSLGRRPGGSVWWCRRAGGDR